MIVMRDTLADGLLADGLAQLKLALSAEQIEKLLAYCRLLAKWNQTYNLTAIRDPHQMISHHVLDSLSIHTYLRGDNFIDVGSGAGLPGMILAIAFPERQWDLLDSNGKKARFLCQAKAQLSTPNVTIYHARVEQHPLRDYDGVLTRAFSSLSNMVRLCRPLLTPKGKLYAMKGRYPAQELEALSAMGHYRPDCYRLKVPGVSAERHLVVV